MESRSRGLPIMSATLPTPASTAGSEPHGSSPTVNAMNTKPAPQPRQRGPSQRVLACHLCQKRKIKCDRCFPCANCTKKGVQCVPVAQPRQRRRRFPERKLLERLREVEGLLAKNNIKFEPLHGEPQAPDGDSSDSGDDSGNENDGPADPSSSTPGTVKSTDTQEAKCVHCQLSFARVTDC